MPALLLLLLLLVCRPRFPFSCLLCLPGALSFMLFNYKCGVESKGPHPLGPASPPHPEWVLDVTPVCLTDGNRRLISSLGMKPALARGIVLHLLYLQIEFIDALLLPPLSGFPVALAFFFTLLWLNWSMMEMQHATDLLW